MRIVEVFASIQGEGIYAGMPSVFVRTAGCNLRCRWCDTDYALSHQDGQDVPVESLIHQVRDFGVPHVVITGGEPMMWEQVVSLSAAFRQAGHVVTIETAGTIWQPVQCDLMSISPKLANSTPLQPPNGSPAGGYERQRINIDVLRRLLCRYRCQLKFVVEPDDDIAEIHTLLSRLPAVDPEMILLMPQASTRQEWQQRSPVVADLARQHGWRFGPRLQVDLYDNARGR